MVGLWVDEWLDVWSVGWWVRLWVVHGLLVAWFNHEMGGVFGVVAGCTRIVGWLVQLRWFFWSGSLVGVREMGGFLCWLSDGHSWLIGWVLW